MRARGRLSGQAARTPVDPVADIAVGYPFACALFGDETVTCWGRGDEGQTDGP